VEGETEELSLPIIFEGVGLDVLKEGIAIIGVGGKGNLANWWRLFTALKIPTFICFDNDDSDDRQGYKSKESLKAIGIQDDAIAEVLTSRDWNINDSFCVFGQNYEVTMRATFSNYENIENEVKDELGNSKPIIARAVAKRLLEDNFVEEEWQTFREVALKINEL
jgi:putative ATP-dependent endonuclease of OLD family